MKITDRTASPLTAEPVSNFSANTLSYANLFSLMMAQPPTLEEKPRPGLLKRELGKVSVNKVKNYLFNTFQSYMADRKVYSTAIQLTGENYNVTFKKRYEIALLKEAFTSANWPQVDKLFALLNQGGLLIKDLSIEDMALQLYDKAIQYGAGHHLMNSGELLNNESFVAFMQAVERGEKI